MIFSAPKIIENHLKVEFNCSDDNVRSYANDLNDEQKAPSFSNAVSLKSEKSNKLDLLKIKNNSMKPSTPIGHISNMKKKLGLSNHMTKEQLLIGEKYNKNVLNKFRRYFNDYIFFYIIFNI